MIARIALAAAVAAAAAAGPSLAGQASDAFQVNVTLLPADPGSCTASLRKGAPRVHCSGAVIGGGGGSGTAQGQGGIEGVLGYRLPDARVKLASALVEEVGGEDFSVWAMYSSRFILAGGIEYVEMTVAW